LLCKSLSKGDIQLKIAPHVT